MRDFRGFYKRALEKLIGRKLSCSDGFRAAEIRQCESRLKLRLPASVREYYLLAGKHPINREHNRLYSLKRLNVSEGKLIFMEENQWVVFWAVDANTRAADPTVFQATDALPLQWYSEDSTFARYLIKMLRWQRGVH